MYNLLVSGAEDAWKGGRSEFPRARFGEYTAESIKKQFSLSDPETLRRLTQLPALFAYEHAVGKDAHVGAITSIRDSAHRVLRVAFSFDERFPPLNSELLAKIQWELDIDGWELSRTHWAVKDVDLVTALRDVGVAPPDLRSLKGVAPDEVEEALELLERLESMALSTATGSSTSTTDWTEAREALLLHPLTKPQLPRFVRSCSTPHELFRLSQSWGGYVDRREAITRAFDEVRAQLGRVTHPVDAGVSTALEPLNSEYVARQWRAALARVQDDPDGAITLARSFLETVLKHVLDELEEDHSTRDTLSGLFRDVARHLDLAPSQQSEDDFRRLLGGGATIVDAIAAIRNRLGDAHGRGRAESGPESRHAELAVNAAGTVAAFVVRQWRAQH